MVGTGHWVCRCFSRHFIGNVSEAWCNSCDIRDELESPLVVTPFLRPIKAAWTGQVSVQDPVQSWSSFRNECESYHCSATK